MPYATMKAVEIRKKLVTLSLDLNLEFHDPVELTEGSNGKNDGNDSDLDEYLGFL